MPINPKKETIFCWNGEVLTGKNKIVYYEDKAFCEKHLRIYKRKQGFHRSKESPKYGVAAP